MGGRGWCVARAPPGVAVVAEDRPGGSDAVQLGDAVTGGLPDTQKRFLVVHPLEAPPDSVRISASLPLARAGPAAAHAGLALLATEFAWAQRWLTRLRGHARLTVQRVRPAKPSA